MQYISRYSSPLGPILLAANETSLTGLWFEGQKFFARGLDPTHTEFELSIFQEAKNWLDVYFSGQIPDSVPPLHFSGTPFQQEVWEILLTIPHGETMTYGEIAAILAARRGIHHFSAQAVGNAVGRNPVSILIPCHRVIGAGQRLTGYAGGLHRKAALLKLESQGKSPNGDASP